MRRALCRMCLTGVAQTSHQLPSWPGVLLRVSAAQGSNPWCPPSTSASSQQHAAHRSLHCLALDATSGIDAYEDPSSSSQPDQTQPTSRLGSALSTVAATLSELQRLALKSWDGERDAKGRKGQRPLKAEPEPFEAELDEDQYEDGEYEDLGDIDGYDEYEEDEYEFVSDDEFEEFVGTVSNLPETTGTKPDGEEKP